MVNFSHFIIQILVVRMVFIKNLAENRTDKFVTYREILKR